MANPSYVRLSDHMVKGMVLDQSTGWFLSGYDVKPFPEDKEQAKFVKSKINQGVLEAAGKAEFEEAHPEDEQDELATDAERFTRAVQAATGARGAGRQEHVLREKETARAGRLQAARAKSRRRKNEDDDTEDEEGDGDGSSSGSEGDNNPEAPRKATGAAKKR